MKIKMLWGQRKCSYPGQYAPELIQCVDENTDEENPDVLQIAYDDALTSIDFESLQFISGDVDDRELKRMLTSRHFTVRVQDLEILGKA